MVATAEADAAPVTTAEFVAAGMAAELSELTTTEPVTASTPV